MKAENYFLRYSFPCAHILLEKKEITEKEFNELKDCAVNNKIVSREMLEKVFYRAFEKIRAFAGKNYWNLETMQRYWREQHNRDIDNGVGTYKTAPEIFKNSSKVFRGRVVDRKDNTLLVEYDGGKRRVFNDLIPEAKIGDYVFIHFGYGVEIDNEDNSQ